MSRNFKTKKRKLISLFLGLVMLIGIIPTMPTMVSAASNNEVIYDMQTVNAAQFNRLTGTSGSSTGDRDTNVLVRNGSATYQVNANLGPPRTVSVTGRGGSSQGVRIQVANLPNISADYNYTFTITGSFNNPAANLNARLRFEGSPQRVVGTSLVNTDGTFTMEVVVPGSQVLADASGGNATSAQYSIGNDGSSTPNMTVTGVVVTRTPASITIRGIQYSTSLTQLDLTGECSTPGYTNTEIEPLKYMTNLKTLYMGENQISDLTPLAGLTNLETLELHQNQISNLQPLTGLISLQSLDLNYNQISDLTPLNGLTNLTALSLTHNPISLSQVEALQANLPSVSISHNAASGTAPEIDVLLGELRRPDNFTRQMQGTNAIQFTGGLYQNLQTLTGRSNNQLTVLGSNNAGTPVNFPNQAATGTFWRAASVHGYNNAEAFQFQLSTTGYENIRFTASMKSTGSGPDAFELAWSENPGGPYNVIPGSRTQCRQSPNVFRNDNYSDFNWADSIAWNDFPLPADAADNKPTVYIRVVFNGDISLLANSGNVAINNIKFIGDELGANNHNHDTSDYSKPMSRMGVFVDNVPNNISNTITGDPKTTRTISWQTNPNITTGTLIADGGYGIVHTVPANRNLHSLNVNRTRGGGAGHDTNRSLFHVDLKGLRPGTEYTYYIEVDGIRTIDYKFMTKAENDDSFTILHVADPQMRHNNGFRARNSGNSWQHTLNAAFEKVSNPAFVFNAGDVSNLPTDHRTTQRYTLQLQHYFDYAQNYLAENAFVYALGNNDVATYHNTWFRHDVRNKRTLDSPHFSFEYGNTLFVSLHHHSETEIISGDDRNWIRSTLENSTAQWKVVMMHKAPWENTSPWGNTSSSNNNDETFLANLFSEHGVDLVLAGHSHRHLRTYPIDADGNPMPNGQGTVYSIPNIAAFDFENTSTTGEEANFNSAVSRTWLEVAKQPNLPMFSAVTFNADSIELKTYAVLADGTTRLDDTFVIEAPVASKPVGTVFDAPMVGALNGNDVMTTFRVLTDGANPTVQIGNNTRAIPHSIDGSLNIPTTITHEGVTYSITTIGRSAFFMAQNNRLTSLTIPDSVITIGDDAFRQASDLESVTIGNGVTSIGYGAFVFCFSLTSVTIPNSVKSIGEWAFADCSNLTDITIGSGVTFIGSYAFYNWSSGTTLTRSVTIHATTPPIINADFTFGYNRSRITLNVPDGTKQAYTDAGWTHFRDLTVPEFITIGGQQFSTSLTELDLSTTGLGLRLYSADIEPLKYMTSLRRLDLSDQSISDLTPLRNLKNLTWLKLWETYHIDNLEPLSGLTNLTYLSISDGNVTDIEPLRGLKNLRELYLPYLSISNIEPLGGLTNLEHLNLSFNQISNVTALRNLTRLDTLNLRSNPIPQSAIDSLRMRLEDTRIIF